MAARGEFDEAWVNNKKREIREAFALFDKEGKGQVIEEEAPTILRFLGIYPSEREMVREILPAMRDDEPTKTIAYDRFETKVLQLAQSGHYEPATEEQLLQAFRVMDPDGNGYVEAQFMRDLLVSKGTPFRDKEIDAFFSVARDMETGHIYYEDYIALLLSE